MKGAIQSKTIWFAIAVTVIGIWEQFAPFIPPDQLAKVITVIGPVIAILRMVTNQPLAEKGAHE